MYFQSRSVHSHLTFHRLALTVVIVIFSLATSIFAELTIPTFSNSNQICDDRNYPCPSPDFMCIRNICECKFGYQAVDEKSCSKINCPKNLFGCDKFKNSDCDRASGNCTCKKDFLLNKNTNACESMSSPKSPPFENSGWIFGPVGVGIFTALAIIAIWRIIHRRRAQRRWAHFIKSGPTQLPVGSYPVANCNPLAISPTGAFNNNYIHQRYPAPLVTTASPLTYPGQYPSEGPVFSVSAMTDQSPMSPLGPYPQAQQQYGTLSHPPHQIHEFPPPYSTMDLPGCSSSSAGGSGGVRPDSLDLSSSTSSHLTVSSDPSTNNRYSPLSSSKLTLL